MKRLLIVTYYWPPSGGAGVQRWVKLSRYFAEKGVEVHVVTVDPGKGSYALMDPTLQNDVHPSVKVHRTDTFEPFGIYKAITGKKQIPFGGFANEDKEKIKFSQKFTRFVRGNMFLPDARVGWNKYAYRECAKIIEKEKIDAVITTSPPHSTQLVGLKLKKKFGIKWLADLRDPWTDIYYYDKLYLTSWARSRDAEMERKVLETADEVVVVSDEIKRNLAEKVKLKSKDSIHVVPNGFDVNDFKNVKRSHEEKKLIISYTGTLTNDYRIDAFLSAIKRLLVLHPEFFLHITGSFPESVREAIRSAAGDHVKFLPHVAHHEAVEQMCAADILLLVIPEAKGNKGILTGKLFEYLASYKPIICIGPVDGDAARIIATCSSGKTFSYEDGTGMEKYLEEIATEWKRTGSTSSGIKLLIDKYSREMQATQMLELLNRTQK
ncbi:MAG TPA: glycosyltransferase family 4 protein [Bacteroidia bacterium]|jgi:glycosyltransferase involved in cell wall biosynthesis|nr:glycosyltransferase family 4 protein [Bacteroidia bacterium]